MMKKLPQSARSFRYPVQQRLTMDSVVLTTAQICPVQ